MSDRLESLYRLAAEVAAARNESDLLSVVVDRGAALADAAGAVVGLVEGDLIRVAAERGYPPGYLEAWRTFPLAPGSPMSEVVETRQPVYCNSRGERDRRWPAFRGTGIAGGEAFAVLPLVGGDGVLGALTLSYLDVREFDRGERGFLEAFVAQCAVALERTRALAEEQHLSRWLSFLAEAGETLSASLDYEQTLAEVGRLIVPRFADWFSCDLLAEGRVDLVAVAHVDPEKVSWARRLRELSPINLGDSAGLPNVLRTGRAEFHETVTDEMIAATGLSPDGRELIEKLGLGSVLIVPLLAHGEVLGALTLVFAESGRHYVENDLGRAQQLAARIALAIENARLYEAQRVAYESERILRTRTDRLQRYTARLAPALTTERVVEIAIDKAINASGGSTALVALAGEDEGSLEIKYPFDPTINRKVLPRDDASVFGEVLRSKEPLWLGSRREWSEFPSLGSRGSLRAIAVLPVATPGRFFGVLGITFDQEREFPEDEQRFLMAIAGQTAQALDRARLYEHQSHVAKVLQQSLLPHAMPSIPGVELAASFRPAGNPNEVGGDFYDVFRAGDRHVVAIGDVCGKGPDAAARTGLCRYALRAAASWRPDVGPAELLAFLNTAFLEHSGSTGGDCGQFASVTCVVLQRLDGDLTATIASGGHPPTLVLRRDGTLEGYESTGGLLGILDSPDFHEHTVTLEPDDVVVLFTDGLTDARLESGERVGEDAVRSALAALDGDRRARTAIGAVEAVLADVEITDDVAIVSFRAKAAARAAKRVNGR